MSLANKNDLNLTEKVPLENLIRSDVWTEVISPSIILSAIYLWNIFFLLSKKKLYLLVMETALHLKWPHFVLDMLWAGRQQGTAVQ